jgi:hypothetical protein
MPLWTVSIDRRTDRRDEILQELRELDMTVEGLRVEIFSSSVFDETVDQGRFRDFVATATIAHDHSSVLEAIAEELLDVFGWLVDFREPPSVEPT